MIRFTRFRGVFLPFQRLLLRHKSNHLAPSFSGTNISLLPDRFGGSVGGPNNLTLPILQPFIYARSQSLPDRNIIRVQFLNINNVSGLINKVFIFVTQLISYIFRSFFVLRFLRRQSRCMHIRIIYGVLSIVFRLGQGCGDTDTIFVLGSIPNT